MNCFNCGSRLSEKDYCTRCGVDVARYKKIIYTSNKYYNEGLARAQVRDLSGAVDYLHQSVKLNYNNIEARNLLGLVYFEMGEFVRAMQEWIISKNTRPEKNLADDYINIIRDNPSHLEVLGQTIRKYNTALSYCQQEGYDLAIIQLKRVLSMTSNFVKAHQLLALLYIESGEWERAKRELERAAKIDVSNTTTLLYKKELQAQMAAKRREEPQKKKPKPVNEDVITYVSGNETIIQPVNTREHKGVQAAVNIAIGVVLGVAAAMFLILPGRMNKEISASQEELREISEQLDRRTSTIEELEQQVATLSQENADLRKDAGEGDGVNEGPMDSLLAVTSAYLNDPEDKETLIPLMENIDPEAAKLVSDENFQAIYTRLLNSLGPAIAEKHYEAGMEAYRRENYEESISELLIAKNYDQENVDIVFNLGNSYRQNGQVDDAVNMYNEVIALAPDSPRSVDSKDYIERLSRG